MSHNLRNRLLRIFSNSLPTLISLQARSSININLSLSPPHCRPSTKFNNFLLYSDRTSQCKTKFISSSISPLVHCLQILSSLSSAQFIYPFLLSTPQLLPSVSSAPSGSSYTQYLPILSYTDSSSPSPPSALNVAPLEPANSSSLPSIRESSQSLYSNTHSSNLFHTLL